MVKAKKPTSKKAKQDEAKMDIAEDPGEEDTVAVGETTENTTEEEVQENGDDSSNKKKPKLKTQKKEETDDSAKEEDLDSNQQNGAAKKPSKKSAKLSEADDSAADQQNGSENPAEKKKQQSKKASKVAKPFVEPSRKSTRTPKPVTKESREEEGYEVEKIIDFQLRRGKPQYLIRWKGFKESDDTWENESSLNCPDLLQKFKDQNATKIKKRSASKSPVKSVKKSKESEKDYEVEDIVGLRIKNGKKEFKIRWKGYKASDDSWEPEKHLSCQDLISKYLEQHKNEQNEEKKTKKKAPAKSKKSKKGKAK